METYKDEFSDWHTRGLEGWLKGYRSSARWIGQGDRRPTAAHAARLRRMVRELSEDGRAEAMGFAAGLRSAGL